MLGATAIGDSIVLILAERAAIVGCERLVEELEEVGDFFGIEGFIDAGAGCHTIWQENRVSPEDKWFFSDSCEAAIPSARHPERYSKR
jgi:hypothetical protein